MAIETRQVHEFVHKPEAADNDRLPFQDSTTNRLSYKTFLELVAWLQEKGIGGDYLPLSLEKDETVQLNGHTLRFLAERLGIVMFPGYYGTEVGGNANGVTKRAGHYDQADANGQESVMEVYESDSANARNHTGRFRLHTRDGLTTAALEIDNTINGAITRTTYEFKGDGIYKDGVPYATGGGMQERGHSEVLTFDADTLTPTLLVQGGPITYTLAASGHKDGKVKRVKIQSDGVNPISFPEGTFKYGLPENGILQAGIHLLWMCYVNGELEVSVPTNTITVSAPTEPEEPTTLGGTELLYDSSTAVGYTETDGKATQLNDMSGKGRHAVQATTNKQAYTDLANKQISFTNVQQYSFPALPIPLVGFTAVQVCNKLGSEPDALFGSESGNAWLAMRWTDTYCKVGSVGVVAATAAGTESQWLGLHVWVYRYTGGSLEVWRDGVLLTQVAASFTTAGEAFTQLGASNPSLLNPYRGNLKLVQFISRVITDTELQDRVAELKIKFDIV